MKFAKQNGFFLFASYYGQKSKMPNAGAEKFPFHLLLQSEQGKMAGNAAGATKKAANLFQTYCFRWPLRWAAGIQFLRLVRRIVKPELELTVH